MITMQKSKPMQPTHLSCSRSEYMNRNNIHLTTAETFSSVGQRPAIYRNRRGEGSSNPLQPWIVLRLFIRDWKNFLYNCDDLYY